MKIIIVRVQIFAGYKISQFLQIVCILHPGNFILGYVCKCCSMAGTVQGRTSLGRARKGTN